MSTLNLLDWTPGVPSPAEEAPEKPRGKPSGDGRPTIQQRYEAFRAANPHVFVEMLRLARARLDRGEAFVSVKALWEELRVSLAVIDDVGTPGHVADIVVEPYKLNNDYTAFYARALIAADPRLAGVIQVRKRKGEP